MEVVPVWASVEEPINAKKIKATHNKRKDVEDLMPRSFRARDPPHRNQRAINEVSNEVLLGRSSAAPAIPSADFFLNQSTR
jgi:hypothetical protein